MSKNKACMHCATGTQLLVKNLSASEIVMQMMIAKRHLNDFGDQTTYKSGNSHGIRETLTNYKETKQFIKILMKPEGIHISKKSITLSTIGIPDKIIQFTDEVSSFGTLNYAGTNEKKKNHSIKKKDPLEEVIKSCKYYTSVEFI